MGPPFFFLGCPLRGRAISPANCSAAEVKRSGSAVFFTATRFTRSRRLAFGLRRATIVSTCRCDFPTIVRSSALGSSLFASVASTMASVLRFTWCLRNIRRTSGCARAHFIAL